MNAAYTYIDGRERERERERERKRVKIRIETELRKTCKSKHVWDT
jgi:hypothetical protein